MHHLIKPTHQRVCSIFIVLILISGYNSFAQTKRTDKLIWLQYKAKIGLTEKWTLTLDLQHRRQDFLTWSGQQVLRPGFTRSMKNGVNLTLGNAFFWHNISDEAANYRFEVRPYTFLEWKQPLGKTTISHRSRFELRYNRKTSGQEILDGYNFNYRAGHRMGISIPVRLESDRQWYIELYDEVLINFGKRIRVNHLDQNRMFIGLKTSLNEKTSFKLGYMYIFVPTGNADLTVSQHTIVLGFGQNW